MGHRKFKWTAWWFLSLQITLYLFFIFVQGAEETDEAYRSGRNLVLEYFLPINLPAAPADVPIGREKRDVEGSGEDETTFSELNEKSVEGTEVDNATQNAFVKLIAEGDKSFSNLTNIEGSGEVEDASANSSEENKDDAQVAPIMPDTEVITAESPSTEETSSESEEVATTTDREATTKEDLVSTEVIFDKSEDFTDEIFKEATTVGIKSVISLQSTTLSSEQDFETGSSTEIPVESTTVAIESLPTEERSDDKSTTAIPEEETTIENISSAIVIQATSPEDIVTDTQTEITTLMSTDTISSENVSADKTETVITEVNTVTHSFSEATTNPINIPLKPEETPKNIFPEPTPISTVGLPVDAEPVSTTLAPVVEEIIKEVKTPQKTLEASPGNILRKENLSLGADPLLIVTNTRLMDSEETVQLSSEEPKRLGAYIVIGLILLSFSSLVGYIAFRNRLNRKRKEFENNQESNDTEKALLSLSDYKDNSELEENHLKNNEITPIVVKSNSQINKFEKNTNFSSPKNLNIANEKNIEKDNVLKSTAETLTQVIIEDSPKDVEDDKNMPNMERLIVKTRIDQDSIPKKPIIINRSSTGYIPIPQDSV